MRILAPTVTTRTTAGDIWVPEAYRQSGEPTGIDPDYPTTLSFAYGATTSTLTITPTGSEMHIWLAGVRHVLTGPQTITFSTADGAWYFSYVEGVGWRASQTIWTIDPITAPCALVYINKTQAAGLLADERHGIAMDWATHQRLHHVDGSQVSGGAAISGYTVYATAGSNPAAGDNTYALASCTLRDEDIALTVPAIADGGPYVVARKTGAGTLWAWDAAAVAPFYCTNYTAGASYIGYNQYTGGAWQMTPLANNQFCNYYIFATDFISPSAAGYLIIPGQAFYTSLAAAQAESVLGLDLSGFPSAEFAPVWQVTFVASSNNNFNDMIGRCSIAATPVRLVGFKTSVASAIAPSSHASLSHRDDPDQHPASSITNTPAGGIAATDVQSALNELDSEKATVAALGDYVPKIGTYAATSTDLVTSKVTGDAANRWVVNADGSYEWGDGTNAPDTNLYRYTANYLGTDDSIYVGGSYLTLSAGARVLATGSTAAGTVKFSTNVSGDVQNRWYMAASGAMTWGDGTNAPDTGLYRYGAAQLLASALYMAAQSSVGTTPHADIMLRLGGTAGAGTTTYGLVSQVTAPATSTVQNFALYTQVVTAAASFTMGGGYGLYVASPNLGANSAVTTQYGISIAKQAATGITTAYALYQDDVNDQNRFQGRVGIGVAPNLAYRLHIAGTHPSTATGLYGVGVDYTVPSTATGTQSALYARPPTTAAASFTANYSIGLWIPGGAAAGAGSTINQRYGIYVDAITGATNNYTCRLAASAQGTLWVSADADNTTGAAGIMFGSSKDTNIYRGAANQLKTDDALVVGGSYVTIGTNPATDGILRLPNNTNITWRNAANSDNLYPISVTNTDALVLAVPGLIAYHTNDQHAFYAGGVLRLGITATGLYTNSTSINIFGGALKFGTNVSIQEMYKGTILLQNQDVTQLHAGGGLILSGNGYTTNPSWGSVGAGMTHDMATYTARHAEAADIKFTDGAITFYTDSALTPGVAYTPTARLNIGSTGTITAGGDLNMGGYSITNADTIAEHTVTFTPSTIGWYRLLSYNGARMGGTLKMIGFYDNSETDVEIQFHIGGYSVGGSIQETRYSSYNGGVIDKVRISSDGGGNVYLDVYVYTATSPTAITIYGYGPGLPAFVANPVVGAVAGSTDVNVLYLGHGFRSTSGFFNQVATTSTDALNVRVQGDGPTYARFVINGDGGLEWGSGAGPTDVLLYRLSADSLYTPDNFSAETSVGVGGAGWFGGGGSTASDTAKLALNVIGDVNNRFILNASGGMQWGNGTDAPDVYLARTAANTLGTNDSFGVYGQFTLGGTTMPFDNVAFAFLSNVAGSADSWGVYQGGLVLTPPTGFAAYSLHSGGQVNTGVANTIPIAYSMYVGSHTKLGTGTVTSAVGLRVDTPTIGTNNTAVWISSNGDYTTPTGGIVLGASTDTNLYRGAANQLKTDDAFVCASLSTTGDFRTGNQGTISLTRTIPTVVNDEVDIGSFGFTNGGGVLEVEVIVPNVGYSQSKSYTLPIGYAATSGAWTTAIPTGSSGAYASQDVDLDINVNLAIAYLRLRRSAGSTAGTAYVTIRQHGVSTDAFTASTSTSSVAAPTTYFNQAFVGQVGGKLTFGVDTNLYRTAADSLKTDDYFTAASVYLGSSTGYFVANGASAASTWRYSSSVSGDAKSRHYVMASGAHYWGDGTNDADTDLYRNAANELKTDDRFTASYSLTSLGANIDVLSAYAAYTPAADEATYVIRGGMIQSAKYGAFNFTTPYGVRGVQIQAQNWGDGGLSSAAGVFAIVQNVGGTGTIGTASAIVAWTPSASAGHPITTAIGVAVAPQATTGVTTAYAFYQEGTSDMNYFAGRLGIGATAAVDRRLNIGGTHVGTGVYTYGIVDSYTVPSTNTAAATAVYVQPPTTAAAAFTLGESIGIRAYTGAAAGAGSTISVRYGLRLDPQTGASENYTARIDASAQGTLWVGADVDGTSAAAGIAFGTSRDTNLYRSGANTLYTDDNFNAYTVTSRGTVHIKLSGAGGITLYNGADAKWHLQERTDASDAFYIANAAGYVPIIIKQTTGQFNMRYAVATGPFTAEGGPGIWNTDSTANNASELGFYSNDGVIASGIASLNANHASHYASLNFYTRGASGWGNRFQIGDTVANFTTALDVDGAYVSIGSNPAGSGAVRLANQAQIAWQDAANSGVTAQIWAFSNNELYYDAFHTGIHHFRGPSSAEEMTVAPTYAWVAGSFTVGGAALAVGTNPATTGAIRLANSEYITWRNNTNDGNVASIKVNTSNWLEFTNHIAITDAKNVVLATSTGTQWATGPTQKQSWWGATPVAQDTGWSVSAKTTSRTLNCDTVTLAGLADVVGTLIDVLKSYGKLGA